MGVEDQRSGGSGNEDRFPVGMRVLAVDDDPICLKLLEGLLRKCQYHVTTTNQSLKALKMLRENRNNYDLVISDVNMPDMDGFKLLELVGLEMDLPVIMLSAHSDKELVYKGVTHGAVDYLLKPVRIEELKNIWQHVIRRKKLQPKDQNRSANREEQEVEGTAEGVAAAASTSSADQSGKVSRKRKDQDEEEEEGEENDNEDEEPGSQKKPRVVWSVDLHRKFVAAVNQLSLEKAVPKKILDLMNVEGLTRENVASHLQKYRLYLKRISTSQQASLVAAYGAKDSSFLRMGSLDGFGDFRSFSGPGRLSSTSLSSYSTGGMLGRLNSSSGLTLRGITSSGLLQPSHPQLSSSLPSLGKIQPGILSANQNTSLFQGISSALEHNQLQGKSSTHIDDTVGFGLANSFPDGRVSIGSFGNSIPNVSGNPLMLQGSTQQSQSKGVFTTQPSLSVPTLNQESLDVDGRGSSNFLDHSRCNENWQGAVQLSTYPSNTLPLNDTFRHDPLSSTNLKDTLSSNSSHNGNSPIEFSSSGALTAPLENSRFDMQGQTGFIGNVVQNVNYTPRLRWEEHNQGYNPNLNNPLGSANSLISGNVFVGSLSHSMDQRKRFDASLMSQINSSSVFHQPDADRSDMDQKLRAAEDCLLDQTKSTNGFIQNNYDSLDDIMNAVMKRDHNEAILMDGELGFDAYSLESCM
ncbi:hypothetical protein Tsubulata_048120 [Turnera subulata]|uniref:Two-component response regulator n=1 Tax=Turnera subulata TaxID=218843 RepID=A0A9Q0F929_9ROSI|nr:hypothetical protein Tsubulata_048120 [Turnera subulata]